MGRRRRLCDVADGLWNVLCFIKYSLWLRYSGGVKEISGGVKCSEAYRVVTLSGDIKEGRRKA